EGEEGQPAEEAPAEPPSVPVGGGGQAQQGQRRHRQRGGDPVGDDEVLQVDDRDRQESGGQDQVGRERPVGPEAGGDGGEEDSAAGLHQRVPDSDRVPAVPALP